MSDLKDSEGYKSIRDIFHKFKRFHFDLAAHLPYRSVPSWIQFADNRVEDALSRDRGIMDNIKDIYVLSIIGFFIGIISMWFIWWLLGSLFFFGAVLAGIIAPQLLIWAVPILILVMLLPAIALLFRSAIFHVLCKLLGGRGSYTQTMTVLVHKNAAHLILSVGVLLSYAVIVGFFLSPVIYAVLAYSIYLAYRGLKHVHGLTQKRAVIATLGSIFIEYALWTGIAIALYLALIAWQMGVLNG